MLRLPPFHWSCSRIARFESAYFVVTRRGKRGARSLLLSTPGARFPTLAAVGDALIHDVVDRIGRGLQMEQLRVLATKSHQVVMSAVLDHSSMIKNVDPISGADRGEPMRNDQGAAPPQYLVQRGERLGCLARASSAAVGSWIINLGALR